MCYKVCNACYKVSNMYYKVCNKNCLIGKEKLSAKTGKNSSGLVKNILLKIFAVTYGSRCCNV